MTWGDVIDREVNEARAEAIEEGLAKGRAEGKSTLVQTMLQKGITPKEISEMTDLPLEEIEHIAEATFVSN